MDADRSKTDPALMRPRDQHLVDVVLAYVTERLALTEAPIDGFGDRGEMQQALEGLIGPNPNDPVAVLSIAVLSIYEKYLSETVLSAESPRFLVLSRLHRQKPPCEPWQILRKCRRGRQHICLGRQPRESLSPGRRTRYCASKTHSEWSSALPASGCGQ
jgi:hypothetical protein